MNFCGLKISCLSFDNIIDVLEESHSTSILVTVNAEAIVRSQTDERLRNIINDNLASIDGQIPIWMFRTIHGHPPINKISGSDLIYSIPEYAESKGLKVFLLGGNEKSNYGAVQNLKDKCPNLLIKGYSPEYHPYPFPQRISNEVEKRLKEFRPDIIFAGFGMGKQEYWAHDNRNLLNEIGTKLVIGCGGSFDFASGKIRRAPRSVQKIGMVGFRRLANEFKWSRVKRLLLSTRIFYYYYRHHL